MLADPPPYGFDQRLAVAGNAVFWRNTISGDPGQSDIYRCDLPDCPGGATHFATTSGGACWTLKVIADESTSALYWLDQCEGPGGAGIVKRCPFSGCGSEPEIVTPGPPVFVDFALSEHDLWLSMPFGDAIRPGLLRRPR